jgi:hypothetical protein
MHPRVSVFRGEPRHVWTRRLEQRGWPSAAAAEMALFLTEKGTPPPAWQSLFAYNQNVPSSVDELVPRRSRIG